MSTSIDPSSADPAVADKGGYNFGTFGGVYTPALLTILGIVMFMRTNFVLGTAGLGNALVILAIGGSITLATALSIAAVATNTEIGGGGAYYLISRVLGPSFGTSIGLTLFVSQTLAIPFNILGAAEALIEALPGLRPWFPTVNLALGAGLAFFVWKGADWALRAQYVIMAVLAGSVVCFLLGPLGKFSWENLMANWGPVTGEWSAIQLFAIFFPAVTGIMAGVNMSGDLADPHRSIPRGTFWALGTAVGLYVIQMVVAAGCFSRGEMIDTPYLVLSRNALFGMSFMVLAGVQAATLSTALGWLMGAPRVLQSLGIDGALPGIGYFKKGIGPENEPRRAIVLVLALVVPLLIWSGILGRSATSVIDSPINVLSELVSLFFLFSYAIINLAAFVESFGANPSFRPRFRAFHWTIAVYGVLACVITAVLIDPGLSILAGVVLTSLYGYIRLRNLQMAYGDARRGFLYSRIQSMLVQLPKLPIHPKNWRPTITVLSEDPENRRSLIDYAILFSHRRGILSVIQVTISACRENLGEMRTPYLRHLRELALARNWPIFPAVVIAPEFDGALRIILQSHSLDPIRPNIVMLNWPMREERVDPFFDHLRTIVQDFRRTAIVLVNEQPERVLLPRRDKGTIDIWWDTETAGALSAILAYLIQLDRGWRRSVLRILVRRGRGLPESIQKTLEAARIEAEIVSLEETGRLDRLIRNYSSEAELIFLEFPFYGSTGNVRHRIHHLVEQQLRPLPPCFLVAGAGGADLRA